MITNRKTHLLTLLGLVVLSASLTGCVVQSSSSNRCAQLQLTWAINEAATGTPLACEEVPADEVVLFLNGTSYSFPCNAYSGITGRLVPGTYTAQVTLFDRGQAVSDTGAMNTSLPGCGTFDLNNNAPVVFDVN